MPDYLISQVAQRTGFTPSTLRYYERMGLLAANRTGGGYRTYSDAEIARAQFIGRAKRLGLRLADIRDVVRIREAGSCAAVKARLGELIAARSSDIAARITELATFDGELAEARAALAGPTPAGPCDDGCGCESTHDHAAALEVAAIACTLSPHDLTARGREWDALLERASGRVAVTDGIDITFRGSAQLTGQLAELAAREQQCCTFFRFTLEIPAADRVTLRVRAPRDAQQLLSALFGSP